jgi:hypothetical protein
MTVQITCVPAKSHRCEAWNKLEKSKERRARPAQKEDFEK